MCALIISGNFKLSGNARLIAGSLVAPDKPVVTAPTDASAHQSPILQIVWAAAAAAAGYNVYLDKASEHNPPTTKVVDNLNVLSYTPSVALDPNTQYVLRVDAINGSGTTQGDVIAFTTLNPIVVTSLIRFEVGSNGDLITPALLASGTVGAGSWAITPDPAVDLTISTEKAFTAVGFKLSDGSGYSTAQATRSLRCANADDLQRVIATLDQHDKVSIFFPLYLGAGFGLTENSMDFCLMVSGTGISPGVGETNDYSAANWKDNERKIKAHTQAGKADGVYMASNLKWYGVTMLWDPANLLATVNIYDTTTKPWTLVGTTTLALRSFNLHQLMFGHCDAVGGIINSPHYFGLIAVDTANAAFPLLPDEAYAT